MSASRNSPFAVDDVAATVGLLTDPIRWWNTVTYLQFEHGMPLHAAEREALDAARESDGERALH